MEYECTSVSAISKKEKLVMMTSIVPLSSNRREPIKMRE